MTTPRILRLEITCCRKCPYSSYVERKKNQDSGFDCTYPGSNVGRIIDYSDINNHSKNNGWPEIPANCPLPLK